MSDPKPLIDITRLIDFQEAFEQAAAELRAAPFATEKEKAKPYRVIKDGRYFQIDGINYPRRDTLRMLNILRERAHSPTIEEALQYDIAGDLLGRYVKKLRELREKGVIVPRDHELVK